MVEPSLGQAALYGGALSPSERLRQRLFWRDDMENYTTNKWTPGVGDAVNYRNNVPAIGIFEGNYCLELSDATGTPVLALVQFGMMPKTKITIEVIWYCDLSELNQINFEIRNYDGLTRQIAAVKYLTATRQWVYVDANGLDKAIPGGDIPLGDDCWRYLRLVADFYNNKYVKLVTTGREFDLSALSIYPVADTQSDRSQFRLGGILAAAGDLMFFDDFRIYLY